MSGKIRLMLTAAMAVLLAACGSSAPESESVTEAATPRPSLPVVSVDAEQLSQYWWIDDEPSKTEGRLSGRSVSYGCVSVDFGIDADGKVFDVRTRKSWPQAQFVEFVESAMQEYEFEAAETNAAHQPVRTQWLLAVADVDGKRSLHIAEHLLHYCR